MVIPEASVEMCEIWRGLRPSESITQICEEPPRLEIKYTWRELGDQRGRSFMVPSSVSGLGDPPAAGTIQICLGLMFFSTSTVWTVNATCLPSGDKAGSPIRCNWSSASTVKGCFWARATETASVEAHARIWRNRAMRPFYAVRAGEGLTKFLA